MSKVIVVKAEDCAIYHAPGAPHRLVKILTTPEITGAKEISVGMTYCHPGCKGGLHTHKGPEIMVVIHGKGKFFTETEEHILGPGDLIYIPPGVKHGYENVDPVTTLEFIWIYPVPEDTKPLEENWVKVKEHKFKEK